MTFTDEPEQSRTPEPSGDVDPLDQEAAAIDARSDEAPEQIAELMEHAEELGRSVDDTPHVGGADAG